MASDSYRKNILIVLLVVAVAAAVFALYASRSGDGRQAIGPQVPPLGDVQESSTVLEQDLLERIREEPDKAALHAELGDVYFDSGRFELAIPHYRKAVELNPADADSLNDLGLALFYTGQGEAALEALKQATKTDPALQRAWLSRGFVLTRMGRNNEARAALRKAIEIEPGSHAAEEARGMLRELP